MTRRGKWENWKKTQELFYKKTSTNYHKWDMFESSEEEIETEPIVPKNDPAFQAMERDFEERAQRRSKAKKIANELKEKGNECMKRGLYKTANKHYSDALDQTKDLLPVYTNRALARLKLEMWIDAVDDCTRILEYCEVFDNGFTKQADLCYKAFIRRAQAHRGLRDFDEAIKDCDNAAILMPKETDPAKLKR
jgi:tetratricopeptide (TPR) repeat protein